MNFQEHVDRIAGVLQGRGRASYAELKRDLGLEDALLADLAAELVSVRRLAVEIGGDVLAWAGERTDGALAAEGPAGLLVGRARETALLAEYWAQAAAGRGQALVLQGEAGIGKSRLTRALETHLAGQPHLRLRTGGSAFHSNSAFHPIARLLRRVLRSDPADRGSESLRRLESELAACGMTEADAAPIFASVLGIPAPGNPGPRRARTRERQRQETLRLLTDFFVRRCTAQPLLLVIEDLHWVDASTLELLDHLVEAVSSAKMLIVLTARPEFRARWTDRPGVGVMPVGRLGRSQVEHLVSAIAAGRPVPPATMAQIVTRSAGVPLFVEELTKMLLEAETPRTETRRGSPPAPLRASVPEPIQDSLVTRLERLPAGAATAQLASVIGRRFSYAMLEAVADVDEAALRSDLEALVEAGLLFHRGDPPHESYKFKHALVQEAAYRLLPRSVRAAYHGRIAAALDGRSEAAPELLAHHYAEAGLSGDAIRNWHRAGEAAAGRIAYVEAIGHFGSAIRLLQDLPDSRDRRRQELALRTALGVPLVAARGYGAPEVEECYMRAYDLSLELEDRERQFSTLRGLWNLRLVRAELLRAKELGERLLDLARSGRDPGQRVAACRAMGVTMFSLGEYGAASRHFRAAIDAYEPSLHAALAPEHGADPCVVCMAYLGTTTWALGYPDQALRHVQDGLTLASRLGHDLSIAVALTTAGRFHQVRREPHRTREHASAVIALSEELGLPYWRALGGTLHGWAMAREGNARGGIVAIQRGRKALRDTGAALTEPWNLASLADAHRCAGEPGPALGLLTESLAIAEGTGERWWLAEQLRLTGEITLERGGPEAEGEAEAYFERALAVAGDQQAKSLELRAATSLARLLRRVGRGEEGQTRLARICGWFSEGFDTVDLREARATLETPR